MRVRSSIAWFCKGAFFAAVLSLVLSAFPGNAPADPMGIRIKHALTHVAPYPADPYPSSQTLLALRSALHAGGVRASHEHLSLVSGEALVFCFDEADVKEPLRDLLPVDILVRACEGVGVKGEWIVNRDMPTTLAAVKKSIDRGWPAISVDLDGSGPVLVTGYDFEARTLTLLPPSKEGEESTVRDAVIPAAWHGTVPGIIGWAKNPVFAIKGRAENEPDELAHLSGLLGDLWRDKADYPPQAGDADRAAAVFSARSAYCGRAALVKMTEDLRYRRDVSDPVFLWKLQVLTDQLAQRRSRAFSALGELSARQGDLSPDLARAVELLRLQAAKAAHLHRIVSDDSAAGIGKASEFRSAVRTGLSLVYRADALEDGEVDRLRSLKDVHVRPTPRGRFVVVDETARRDYTRATLEEVLDIEGKIQKFLRAFFKGEGAQPGRQGPDAQGTSDTQSPQ